jgi:hypothetical protein
LGEATAVVIVMAGTPAEDKPGDRFVLATVIVATEEVAAFQRLDPLVAQSVFIEVEIPRWALVEGAVTNVRQLAGTSTRSVIRKDEHV